MTTFKLDALLTRWLKDLIDMLNTGYIEGTCSDRDVVVRIYYDSTQPVGPSQPLIDGPRGYCLDVKNTTGRKASVEVTGLTGNPITATIQQGDPVTTGPVAGRSRTAAQLATLGYTTRGSVGSFGLSCG